MSYTFLILPGYQNSGAGHWQTLWEARMPNAKRVQQRDWDAPRRSEWVAAVNTAIRAEAVPIVLIAHSLGCITTAWWASQYGSAPHAARIAGALLVAPPDIERSDVPDEIEGFAPLPRLRLPFPSLLVASSDDPWCALPKAQAWAGELGARFHDIGARGHINAESGLGEWEQGHKWAQDFLNREERSS